MKILIVDCRTGRGKMLEQVLAVRDGRVLKHSEHVNGLGGSVLDLWDKEAMASCSTHLNDEQPDMVLLHVGREQRCWKECLSGVYGNYIVLCYTGGATPDEVTADCSNNLKHTYYPGVVASEYPSENECRHSAAVSAFLNFIESVEEYLTKDKDSREGEEILKTAKRTLQQFNARLETALNDLYEDENWQKLLQECDPEVRDTAMKSLINTRNGRLQSAYQ